jgi:FkbM family methyltransferase
MSAEGSVDRLIADRFFAGQRGVVIEVGAARPDYLSVSEYFRSLGWRVIAVEPNPKFCELHRQKGFEVLQYACGERDEDDVDFTVVDSHGTNYQGGGVSFESFSSLGIKPSYSKLKSGLDQKVIKVRLRRLDTILREHAADIAGVDVLSVDVEGWELEVLRGLDFPRYRPKVMVIENLFSDKEYLAFAKAHGYALWRVAPPNDVYVIEELLTGWERLLSACRYVWRPLRWGP